MKKLTKKQIYEFAKYYISSQMMMIDGGNIGGINETLSPEDCGKIVLEINRQGTVIAQGRNYIGSPDEILDHVIDNT